MYFKEGLLGSRTWLVHELHKPVLRQHPMDLYATPGPWVRIYLHRYVLYAGNIDSVVENIYKKAFVADLASAAERCSIEAAMPPTRKAHHKSRNGCAQCKKRHVKVSA